MIYITGKKFFVLLRCHGRTSSSIVLYTCGQKHLSSLFNTVYYLDLCHIIGDNWIYLKKWFISFFQNFLFSYGFYEKSLMFMIFWNIREN